MRPPHELETTTKEREASEVGALLAVLAAAGRKASLETLGIRALSVYV